MRVTKLTGCTDEYSIEATINERIGYLEDDYDVRVISINVTKDGTSRYYTYSVWVELRERESNEIEK